MRKFLPLLLIPLVTSFSQGTKVQPPQLNCSTSSTNLVLTLGTCVQLDPAGSIVLLTTTNPPTLVARAAAAASPTFVVGEVPTGTLNGVNTVFTLANTPTAGSVAVYLNGIRQSVAAGDYAISGTAITFSSPLALAPTAALVVDYRR